MSKDNAYLQDIHDYDDVNLDIVWKSAVEDLPPLIKQLESYLVQHPPAV
jgi:uncharacterized protein with HEPN domain